MLFLRCGYLPETSSRIEGKRLTAAKVWRADRQDWSQDYIRIDGFIRQNAGVGIGDKVKIRKAKFADAQRIVLAPPSGSHMHYGDEAADMIRRQTLKRPVVSGDILPIMSSAAPSFCGAHGGCAAGGHRVPS